MFWLWVLRWGRLQQLERRIAEEPWRQAQLRGRRPGSVDTIAYGLKHAALGPLPHGLQAVVQPAHRAKVWSPGTVGPWTVITVDGTELWATRRRRCSECQMRLVGLRDARVPELSKTRKGCGPGSRRGPPGSGGMER